MTCRASSRNTVDTKYASHSEEFPMYYSMNKSCVTYFYRIMRNILTYLLTHPME